MNILVTGSAGFIGFHTSKTLLERGDKVVGLDSFNDYYDPSLKEARNAILSRYPGFTLYRGRLEDLDLIRKIFREQKIQKVCHLAAQAGVRYSLTHPHVYIQSNLVGFTHVIHEAKDAGIKTFVYASSSSVYGNNKKVPFSESDPVDHPISLYAASKKANELIAYTYHHLYSMECTGLRFFTVYGPWGRPDNALFLFVNNILQGKPIDVFNGGKMRRNWTYIDDIVSGVVASVDKSYPYEIFNLGNVETNELMYFIEQIEHGLGRKAQLHLMPMQPGDVPETYADIQRAREKLGFEPKTRIEEGIHKFIEWYQEYHSKA